MPGSIEGESVEEKTSCAYPGCAREGFLSFRGHARFHYCQLHYELLTLKIARMNREMSRIRAARRAEAEDHRPARQPREL